MEKQKYVKTEIGEFIIFPISIQHDRFKHMRLSSAGFCQIYGEDESVVCFGDSFSLSLKYEEGDSEKATIQLFGYKL